MAKPTNIQFLVSINHLLKVYFKDDQDKMINWLRTPLPELKDLAPVELIASGQAEAVLAFIMNTMQTTAPHDTP